MPGGFQPPFIQAEVLGRGWSLDRRARLAGWAVTGSHRLSSLRGGRQLFFSACCTSERLPQRRLLTMLPAWLSAGCLHCAGELSMPSVRATARLLPLHTHVDKGTRRRLPGG